MHRAASGFDQQWDRLLRLMYESAHDDARMPAFLQALASLTHSSSVSVLVQDPVSNRGNMELNNVADDDYARIYAEFADRNVLLEAALPHSRTGAVVVSNDYIPDRRLMASAFYEAVCRPFDAHYTMGMCLKIDAASVAGFVLNRTRNRPFTGTDRSLGNRLMPHLQTWFRIRQRIGGLELQNQDSLAALGGLDYGVIVADICGSIRLVNDAARGLIDASGGALVLNRRLSSRSASIRAQLDEAVQDVGTNDQPGSVLVLDTPVKALQVAVMPLHLDAARPRRLLIFLQDRSLAALRALKSLEARFDLTPAESRVGLEILTGRSAGETAQCLGVSPETIKSHLSAIFRKSDCNSQTELVAKVAGFAFDSQ